ncbi:hypothetical protein C7401_14357 [Paraburkholderia unamae]|uniref:zinc-ribbon domain-containing protein n=1 Tax=Paraburkholderia unamae TaxID=219649 RepID=UPI000DC494D3|nr:zinc-ribbon domain-containing protein [Paraburkholderia unamae]RAR50065.1 hypothetical protein C7401_14357 [Paraburkholderia unamae]
MTSSSASSPRVPAATRNRVQRAIAGLPGRAGVSAAAYSAMMLAGIKNVAAAWGGICLSRAYRGHLEPLDFRCAAGHRFPLLARAVRLGHWCIECAYDRTTVHSLEEARAIAVERGGVCLSRHYTNTSEKMGWRCGAGHTWEATLDGVLRGDWCQTCHFESIKPKQEDIEQAALARGGRCLSAYVDKETPLQWRCAKGHMWFAPWSRVSKGQWCHLCAVKARTRTIGQMQDLARSRGGECLSTVYPGTHGKIEWLCAKGHAWHATVNSVWRGSWCPECAHEDRRITRTQGRRGKRVPILV